MIPLADLHCHLLAGLDDGPKTELEALDMCRMAYAEGVRMVSATAHQNEHWPAVTPPRIREAGQRLAERLRDSRLPLSVYPSAEVMVYPDVELAWQRGELVSIADRGCYLLIEMPHGLCVDLRHLVRSLSTAGVRPILAHPEQQAELLHEPGRIEELIEAGCLVQVSSGNITRPRSTRDEKALRSWFRRGVVHVLGSDGHSPRRRPPRMAEAYHRIVQWAGSAVADRVCSSNGMAVLQGLPLRVVKPEPPRKRWFAWF